jgi:hypothetical protein
MAVGEIDTPAGLGRADQERNGDHAVGLAETASRPFVGEGDASWVRAPSTAPGWPAGIGYNLGGELSSEPDSDMGEFLFSITQELLMNVGTHPAGSTSGSRLGMGGTSSASPITDWDSRSPKPR